MELQRERIYPRSCAHQMLPMWKETMTLDLATLRQRQSDARARALAARSAKTDLLSQLNAAGRAIAEAEIDEAKAKQQAKAAREEEQRQERLRAAQRAYLEQQGKDFDTTSFESYEWFDGIFTWQLEAIQFGAAAKRFVLGDEPGLGKTRSAIGVGSQGHPHRPW